MDLMAGGAVTDGIGSVRKDPRPALVGVTAEAWRFAGTGESKRIDHCHRSDGDRRPAMRLVARRTLHAAAIESMAIRLVAERGRLRMTHPAEVELRSGDQMRLMCIAVMNRMTGQAIHCGGIRVHAVLARHVIGR